MDAQVRTWKETADGIWSACTFAHAEAARLCGEIVSRGVPASVARLAREALPGLRNAAAPRSDSYRRVAARRRFGSVREELHAMIRPRFGRREAASPVGAGGSPADLGERLLLGLPPSGRLSGPVIAAAYKRAAKTAHPDRGGDTAAFTALVRARDALIGRL